MCHTLAKNVRFVKIAAMWFLALATPKPISYLSAKGPGREEDRLGEPFVGAAGKLLDKMLAAIRRKRDDGVYITNIVKCRPPDNRNPTPAESAACLPYLHRQIEIIKPRLIVALGARGGGALATKQQKPSVNCGSECKTTTACRWWSPTIPLICLETPWISVNRGKTCAIFAVWRRVK